MVEIIRVYEAWQSMVAHMRVNSIVTFAIVVHADADVMSASDTFYRNNHFDVELTNALIKKRYFFQPEWRHPLTATGVVEIIWMFFVSIMAERQYAIFSRGFRNLNRFANF